MNAGSLNALMRRGAETWRTQPNVRLIVYAVLLVFGFKALSLVIQLGYGISSLKPLQLWLMEHALATDDSWRPMRAAWEWVQDAPDGSLYREIFFERHLKFQYAPTSLLFYSGLEGLGIDAQPVTLNRISRVLVLASALTMGMMAWLLAKCSQTREASALLGLLAGGATLVFFPITYGYQLGQLQVWSNALFVFACLAWLLDRRIVAGVLVGLICLLKPQLGVLGLWALIRGEWRFAAGLAVTGAVGLGLSVLLFGFQNHVAYLEVLSYMARHGEAHLSNHSLNGMLHRLVGNDDGLRWSNDTFSPYHPMVYFGTLISSLALLALGLWRRGSMSAHAGLAQLLFAALAFTIASPMAWEPHYGVLAPAFALLFAVILALPQGAAKRNWLLALACAFAFSANHLPFVSAFAHSPLIPLQSYLLLAGLGLMAMLWHMSRGSGSIAEHQIAGAGKIPDQHHPSGANLRP